MSNYRRAFVPGGTFFFTIITFDRRLFLAPDLARRTLRWSSIHKAKMKTLEYILLTGIFSFTSIYSATLCDQKIFFLLKPKSTSCLFWIGESVFGDCQYAHIIQVTIKDDKAEASFLPLVRISDWETVISA
jgi:hypothetical protein